MEFTIFALLLGFSGVLTLAGTIRRDEYLFVGAGVILFLLGTGIISSGLNFQSGMSITEEQIDSNTTEITKNVTYTSFEESHGASFSSTGLAIILFTLGFYLSVYSIVMSDGRPSMFRGD